MSRESLTRLRQLTGFAPATIKSRIADLQAIKGDRGAQLYETQDALPLLYSKDGSVFDIEQERARLLYHQANNEEYKEKINRGELIAAETVKAEVVGAFANVRARLLSIPSQLAAKCVNATQEEVEQRATELVRQALEELQCQRLTE